jgi:hypothetical protein
MKSSSMLGAAVVAAVPMVAVSNESVAAVVHTESNLAGVGETTRFVTMSIDADLHRPPRVLLAWGGFRMTAGPGERDVVVADPPDFDAYSLIGVSSSGGVFVSFADPSLALGQPFSSLFPSFNEAQVADAIVTGGPLLDQFITALAETPGLRTPMGVECHCTHFSNGTPFGSFFAEFNPVPAPGTTFGLTLAGMTMLVRRRRR